MKKPYESPHLLALLQHASHVQLTSVFFKFLTETEVATREPEDSTEYIEGFLAFFKKVRLAGCIRADMVDGIVEHCSPTIVLALFDRIDDPIPFSNNTLPLLARRFSEKIIAVFLDRHGNNSLITEEVLAAAASNGEHGPDVVTILLQRSVVLPTESVLLAAATNLKQGLHVFTILLDRLSKTSGEIVDTDRKNVGVVLEGLLAKNVLFAGLETCFAGNITQYCRSGNYFPRATLQDQALRIVAMFIERGVSVVFDEDDLLRLFELYTLAPQFHFILQTHRGRLPTITSSLIARVQLRVKKYLFHNVFCGHPYHNPTLYDPLFVPAINLAVRDIDPITFNSLTRNSRRPSQEIKAVVESCRGEWIGKQIMLQVLNSQEMASASNSMRSVQLLLDLFPGKVPITEEVLFAAARSSKESYETLRLLLSCSLHQISVTEKVMIALLQNPNSCLSAFRLVLKYGGSNLLWSQEIKTSIVRNAERSFVLQFFLEQPGFSLTVTESMIRPDYENDEKPGKPLESTDIPSRNRLRFPGTRKIVRLDEDDEKPLINSNLLFKSRNVRFTSASIALIMARGDTGSTMSLLEKLSTDRDDRHLTEDVFLHAISNEHETACFATHHLLSHTSNYLTEKAWIAAAKNRVNGWTLMQIFADYDPNLESMTPTVLVHAARNDKLGHHILKWLLSYHPSKVHFSDEILAAISANPVWWTGEPITRETYRPHLWQNGPILEVILHQAQEKAQITENILISAVKNPRHSARYLRVLLQHPTREALNLQNVARIAVAQKFVNIKALLSLFQHGARINEDIVVAAMGNSKRGGDIFELLRVENLWGDFVATDKAVLAAAENEQNGNDLLEDFLSSYQGVIVLQDEHIEKVASSFNSDVLRQLRIRQRFPVSKSLPVFVYF